MQILLAKIKRRKIARNWGVLTCWDEVYRWANDLINWDRSCIISINRLLFFKQFGSVHEAVCVSCDSVRLPPLPVVAVNIILLLLGITCTCLLNWCLIVTVCAPVLYLTLHAHFVVFKRSLCIGINQCVAVIVVVAAALALTAARSWDYFFID